MTHGSLEMEVKSSATCCGACSTPKIHPNGAAPAAITRIAAVSRPVVSKISGSPFQVNVR